MNLLELSNVSFSYYGKYRTVNVLKNTNYSLEQGKVYAIVGKSGSGKSTLISLLAGLTVPTGGDVLYNGTSTKTMKLDKYRLECASMIFQNFRLLPLLSVLENVMYPLELRGIDTKEAEVIAREKLASMDLPDSLYHRIPSMLSGGEQQRVAIARALTMNSHLLLADEPTGNLDEENSKNVISILSRLAHENDYCVVIVTHDLDILPLTDIVLKIVDGELREFPNQR